MKIYSPKNKFLVILFFTILSTISCSSHLPSDKNLVEDFTQNAVEYQNIVKIFKENGFVSANEYDVETFSFENGNYSFNRCNTIGKPQPMPEPTSESHYKQVISQTLIVFKPINKPCPNLESLNYLQSKIKEFKISEITYPYSYVGVNQIKQKSLAFRKIYLREESWFGNNEISYTVSYIYQPEKTASLIDSVNQIKGLSSDGEYYRKINDDWFILVKKTTSEIEPKYE